MKTLEQAIQSLEAAILDDDTTEFFNDKLGYQSDFDRIQEEDAKSRYIDDYVMGGRA